MADYLLDTNILSLWYDTSKSENSRVVAPVNAVRQLDPTTNYMPRFFVSVVALGELEYGARVSHIPNPAKQAEYAAMDAAKIRFVREQCPIRLEMNDHVAEEYGELKAWLFNDGRPMRKNPRSNAPKN